MNSMYSYKINISIQSATWLFVILFFIVGCASKKRIIKDAKKVIIEPQLLPKDDSKTAIQLAKLIKQNEFRFNTLSLKAETDLNLNDERNSFTVSVRMKRDSIIWASISPAMGIEAARAVLTKDSVMVIDRINHRYFAGNYSYLNKLLNAEIDFEMVQSLLVGNAIDYYEDERLTVSRDLSNKLYILSSLKKRKLKKVLKDAIVPNEPVESLWIIPERYKVSKIYLDDVYNKRTFQVIFDSFQQIDSLQIMPTKASYEIRAQKNIFIDLVYNKVTLDEKLEFPFRIPEKYSPIKQEDEKN